MALSTNLKIDIIKNRISLLQARGTTENAPIIRKLERRLKNLRKGA